MATDRERLAHAEFIQRLEAELSSPQRYRIADWFRDHPD